MSDGANRMISDRKAAFYASMKNHQIAGAGISWFSMLVTLESSDNRHIAYPVVGVIRFVEQKTDLGVRTAVFHALRDDGSLGPPGEVINPVFRFSGDLIDNAA